MTTEIKLEEMRFYARHGVLEQERQVGNRFVVNLSLSVDVTQAVISDAIEDTIHYGHVYEAVKEEIFDGFVNVSVVDGVFDGRQRRDLTALESYRACRRTNFAKNPTRLSAGERSHGKPE